MHHQHTIAVLHQLGHIVGNHQDGETFITGKLADDIVDLRLGADIDTDSRPVEDQHFRACQKPACQHHTLGIAA